MRPPRTHATEPWNGRIVSVSLGPIGPQIPDTTQQYGPGHTHRDDDGSEFPVRATNVKSEANRELLELDLTGCDRSLAVRTRINCPIG